MNRYSASLTISKQLQINCIHCNKLRFRFGGYRRYSDKISTKSTLKHALINLKTAFPNRSDLYSRIDLVVSSTPTSKIGIIPFNTSRYDIKALTESLLADPLASNQDWFEAFKNRLLSKDVLIKWAPVFEYVGNKNSLIEYPIPFHTVSKSNSIDDGTFHQRENTQILEANSLSDSIEHLKDCHLHIFVTNNLKDVMQLSSLPLSEYPSILVVDVEEGAGINLLESYENDDKTFNPTKTDNLPSTLWVSSKTALQAVDKLIQSPANSSFFLAKWKQSRMATLENIVFSDIPTLNRHLIKSIVDTCQSIVEPSLKSHADEQAQAGTIETIQMREKWAQGAHRELQTSLSDSLDQLENSTLAWWKLYYKVDDIYDTATQSVIYRKFLPLSKDRLEYCLGRIDQQAIKIYGSAPKSVETSGTTQIFDAQNELAANEAVTLHDAGLRLLTTTVFGIQLPLIIIPILGVYFYDYSLYSMGSIIALGTVVGFRYLQKGWLKATNQFNLSVKERARQVLTSCERLIWTSYESKVLEQQRLASHRVQLIEDVRKASSTSP